MSFTVPRGAICAEGGSSLPPPFSTKNWSIDRWEIEKGKKPSIEWLYLETVARDSGGVRREGGGHCVQQWGWKEEEGGQ